MKRVLKVSKKISCILGILFIILGVVPVPQVSQVSQVSAETLSLPNFSSVDLFDVLSEDSGEEVGGEETGGEETGDEETGGEETGGEETGGEGEDGGDGECDGEECEPPLFQAMVMIVEPCIPGSCPTVCGFDGDPAYPDGCNGTLDCPATEPCESEPTCAQTGEHCSDDTPCCSSDNYCAGNGICKDRPDDQCKDLGGPCGGANECCPGLICDLQGGSENGKCGFPPQPVDCVGDWGLCEGDCGTTGTQIYHITTPAANGGAACKFTEGATRDCQTNPCPVDCEGYWGGCEGDCGQGVKTYHIIQEAMYGGNECDYADGTQAYCELDPCPVDCEGYWGECVGECGTGTRTYHVTQEAMYGGAECDFSDGYSEGCDLDPCPIACEGEWSECEGECGTNGVRTFTVTVEAQYGGKECEFDNGETEDCETDPCPEDCIGEWSECEGECGSTGVQIFTITKPAEFGGAECEFDNGEERGCETDPCPIECEGEWGSCSGPCGTVGVQTFTILVEAENGGEKCEFSDGATRECQNPSCPPPPPPPPPPPDTPIVPVTGAGGPTEELIIIPVTGVDLRLQLAGFQKLLLYMGLMLFGITTVLEGVTRKFNF